MRSRTLQHPGIEHYEVDLSQYTDEVNTSNHLVIGFSHQGKSKTPIDWITSTDTLKNYFGEPRTEAERYFYTACKRILTQKGRIYAVRIPYVNESEDCVPAFTYSIEEGILNEYKDDSGNNRESDYGGNLTYLPTKEVTDDIVAELANRGLVSKKNIKDFLKVATPTDDSGNKIFPDFSQVVGLYKYDYDPADPEATSKSILSGDSDTVSLVNKVSFGGTTASFAILCDAPESINALLGTGDGSCNADEDTRFIALTNVEETSIGLGDLVDEDGKIYNTSKNVSALSGVYDKTTDGKTEETAINLTVAAVKARLNEVIHDEISATASITGDVKLSYEIADFNSVTCYENADDDGNEYFEGTYLTKGLKSGYYLKAVNVNVKVTGSFKVYDSESKQTVDSSVLADSQNSVLVKNVNVVLCSDADVKLGNYYRATGKDLTESVIYASSVIDVSKCKGAESFFGKGCVPEELKNVQRIVRIHRNSKTGYMDSALAEELADGDDSNIKEIITSQKGFVLVNTTNHVLKPDAYNNYGEETLGIVPFVFTGFNKLPMSRLVTPAKGGNAGVFQPVHSLGTGSSEGGAASENILTKTGFSKDICTIGTFDANADTIANQVVSYFPTLVAKDGGELPGEEMNYVAVLVAELKTDPNYDNKVVVTAKELFYGNFDKDSSLYLPRLINEGSNYMAMYTNYTPSDEYKKNLDKMITVVTPYDETDGVNNFWYLKNTIAPVMGYTSKMTTKMIKYKNITDTLDAVTNLLGNVDESDIDIVVDAGLTSIANLCVKAMGGEDNATGVKYDTKDFDKPTLMKGDCINNASAIAVWKTVASKLIKFCEVTRKDCYAYIDGPRELSVNYNASLIDRRGKKTIDNDILPRIKYMAGLNSSYGGGVLTWVKEVDDTTGCQYWCPPSILKAEKTVWTDLNYAQWLVPVGTERGTINDGIEVSFNPTPAQEDVIYPARWNYVKNIKGDGIVFWGQRNFLTADSMLNRESTRRMFLYVERKCRKAMKRFLFKPISTALMNNVVDALTPILQDVQDREGCYDFKILCSSKNNTPESIMRNELRVGIAIHPTPLAEYVVLGFFCVGLNIAITEELIAANS